MNAQASPTIVKVVKNGDGFQLLRDGKPYLIRGVGFGVKDEEKGLKLLKEAGGNAIRTWGAENVTPLLDKAHAQGISVTIGIWLGHEQHGFKYDDPAQVSKQFEQARAFVRQYRDHPALLMWGIGNEMEGRGDNARIWQAVNDIAKMVKQEDPNHPTMTVIAEVGGPKIPMLLKHCPDIDVLGVNSYAGLASMPRRLKEAGWTRPYVVTEFGPFGPWEVGKTSWNAPLEATSTEKAEVYRKNYTDSIAGQKGWCLGSFAFLWGNKQEATATWFGMLLPDNTLLESVDVMTLAWTGKPPKNRAPQITLLDSEAKGKEVAPGARLVANVTASDPDNDPLSIVWAVRSENTERRQGGDTERDPSEHPDAVRVPDGKRLVFEAPPKPGPYRVFVTVYDGRGRAATANFPFFVKQP